MRAAVAAKAVASDDDADGAAVAAEDLRARVQAADPARVRPLDDLVDRDRRSTGAADLRIVQNGARRRSTTR